MKISTNVRSRPTVVAESNLCINTFSKYSVPLRRVTKTRVRMPPANGITTNSTTLRISVSKGTLTLDTPSRNFTMGTKATRIMMSFVATYTTVFNVVNKELFGDIVYPEGSEKFHFKTPYPQGINTLLTIRSTPPAMSNILRT